MMGFVSALSSSLAVVILIMAVMLMNMVKSAHDASQKIGQSEITDSISQADEGLENGVGEGSQTTEQGQVLFEDNGNKSITLNPNIISKSTLDHISKIPNIQKITTYCTYGNNLNLDTALKYTTFNVIAINKKFSKLEITTKSPVLEKNEQNRCYIDYK